MHAIKTTDAAVIRASRRDPAAFGQIFDRHWPRIHRYCVARAGPPGEDVASETFRVAFIERKRYDGREDAAPWLYGIATNLLRRLFRSSARDTRTLARSPHESGPDEHEVTLDRLEAEELGQELVSALAGLSDVDRDTLLLHTFADLTYEQVARATGAPVGTVASRINRARARVRAHLEAKELCR